MIQLNYRDAKPIYEQIKDGLKHLLVSKAIETGEKLPSARELAASLAINPNTIQRAYKELESEGYIYTVSGKGTFAAGQDDVVEIRKVSDDTLVGSAPDITRHFIELRGIGIVDVKSMFGVQSVRETQNIDLVITLEDWSREKEYDRLGLEEEYTEFLGNRVVCHNIPIRPGRNLAIIVESAAVNHRQKQMGYNAAQELYKRVQENLAKRRK